MSTEPLHSELYIHEWMAVIAIIGVFILMTMVSHPWRAAPLDIEEGVFTTDPFTIIHVQGAVARPGALRLKKGATVQDVLDQVQPLPEADLSRLKPGSKIRKNQVIKVPSISLIKVKVEGAVPHMQEMALTKGSTIEDLIAKIQVSSNADPSKLHLKRRLKDGDIIRIPAKT